MTYVAAQGVTSVHHMGTWDDLDVFERARTAPTRLRTRIYAAVPLATWERLPRHRRVEGVRRADGRGDDVAPHRRAQGLRRRLARLAHRGDVRAAFTDAPNDRGLFVNTPEDLVCAGSRAPTRPACT